MDEGVVTVEEVADVVVEAEIAEANDGPVTLGTTAGAVGTDVEGKTTGIGTEGTLGGRDREAGRVDGIVFAVEVPDKRLDKVAEGRPEAGFLMVVAEDDVMVVVLIVLVAVAVAVVAVVVTAAETAPMVMGAGAEAEAATTFGCSTIRFGIDFFFTKA